MSAALTGKPLKTQRDTQREVHVKMEAETGDVQPQAKKYLELSDARKDREELYHRTFGGNVSLLILF